MPLIHASHILLKSAKIANRLYPRLIEAELSFSDAVLRYSVCASRAHEGNLGFIAPGLLDDSFEQRLWQAPIAELSSPFKSKYGWHIVIVHHKVWP